MWIRYIHWCAYGKQTNGIKSKKNSRLKNVMCTYCIDMD